MKNLSIKISEVGETFFELDTWLGKINKVKAVTKEDFYLTLDKKNIRHLKIHLEYDGPIVAPIQKDQEIAKLIIFDKNKIVSTVSEHGNTSAASIPIALDYALKKSMIKNGCKPLKCQLIGRFLGL